MPKALRRQYLPKRDQKSSHKSEIVANLDVIPTLRKPKRLHQLNSGIIEEILHAVTTLNWSYREVAAKFNVST